MQHLLQWQHRFRTDHLHLVRGVAMGLAMALVLCGSALGQQIQVSGYVTSIAGEPIADVAVLVQGTDIRTSTAADGSYSLTAPSDGMLVFSAIGYRAIGLTIAGRTTLDVILEPAVAMLEQIIVTGYTEQRRADITGAVSSVDMETVSRMSTTSVLQRLGGQVAGVTVEAQGAPGSRSTVRIRGVSSFQNNNPLYIIDGTPTTGDYFNWLNPNDIESIQVLKDASAASIYGSRATNGVIIIETRKRGSSMAPRFSLDVKVGMARPVASLGDILITDALDYHEIVKRSYENAGLPVPQNIYGDPNNPTLPEYLWPNDGVSQTRAGDVFSGWTLTEDEYLWGDASQQYRQIMQASPGTDWFDALYDPALVMDYNLGVSGSGESHGYNVSLNYLNQEGTAAFNRFQRGSARVNTQFQIGRLSIGENMAVALEQYYGGMGDPTGYAEGTIMGKNILQQPIIPVLDVGGNYAAGKAVGLGNQSNSVKQAWANKDDVGKNLLVFGNVFAGFDVTDALSINTRFGFNLNENTYYNYDPPDPELSEPSFTTGIGEGYSTWREWTWSNTLNYTTNFAGDHTFTALLGQEATRNTNRGAGAGMNNLITDNTSGRYIQDALGDASTKNVNSWGGTNSLLSFFGKVDYNYGERYYLSATVRRDGSSRLGPDTRWGTFPAFSAGWRLSRESFLRDSRFFTNVMVRFGYGITGNQSIPGGRTVSQFGGAQGQTFYDITGSHHSIVPGYRQTSIGNAGLLWEENKSMNAGLDLEFFGGNVSFILDVFQRATDNLLFNPALPATAGSASPPIVNIGEMKNTGFDFSLGYSGTIGASGTWTVNFNGSHYKNEIVRIDGTIEQFSGPVSTRYGNQVLNKLGYPIGAFYGLEWDGFFDDQAEIDAHATQDGAAPGRIKFKDQLTVDTDGDGVEDDYDGQITAADRVIIGSPHPDFVAGLDFGLAFGAWDFSATFFGTFGNEIFDVQKEFYVFRNFSTNVKKDLLTDSWTPELLDNAKYPILDQNDTFSGQQISDYYIEDGSYIRLRNVQVGYRLPESLIPGTRVYVQAENLFTLTGYSGLDPALPAANVGGSGGDIRDQYRGVDRGAYPSNMVISFGINATF